MEELGREGLSIPLVASLERLSGPVESCLLGNWKSQQRGPEVAFSPDSLLSLFLDMF